MAAVGTQGFAGLRPRVAAHLLDDAESSECINAYIDDGRLRPLRNGRIVTSLPEPATTIALLDDYDNPYWLQFTNRARIARSSNAAIDRIYVTEVGEPPKVGNVGNAPEPGMVFYGPGPYPDTMFQLGVPVPSAQPTFVITNATPTAGRDYAELDQETRFYAFTQVNIWDEESAVSPISAEVICYDDSHITVTCQSTPWSGYVPLKAVRIYRTNTGTSATDFQFVAEVAIASENATAVYLDTLPNSRLSEVAETFFWTPPPITLQDITLVAGAFYAGLSGKELCLSEERVPYAWPLAYRFPIDDTPVTIATNGVDLVVLTQGRPVVFTGNTPQAVQHVKLSDYQPCVSVDSVVVTGGMVVYASPDGLIGISSTQGFRNLTEGMLTREQWQALNPSEMRCAVWERRVLVSTDSEGYIFDFESNTYMPITPYHKSNTYNGFRDSLYVLHPNGTDIYAFYENESPEEDFPYTWWSKRYHMPAFSFTCARVHADSYDDLRFYLEVDGVVVQDRYVVNKEPFRLPAVRGRVVRYGLEGRNVVRSAALAQSPSELPP